MKHKSIDKTEILKRLNKTKFYKERIPSLQINGKPEAVGLCPFHDDTNPSLYVNLDKGVYHCKSCGAKGDVFRFYQDIEGVNFSIALEELAVYTGVTDASKSKVVGTFNYTDENGNILYRKKRIEPGYDGKPKGFFFEHPGGKEKTRGCEPVLYRLHEIIQAKEVYIVEGEAKADLLHEWGLTATCLDSGANSPWRAEYSEAFKGKEKVVILPDNDKPGLGYALKIASALYGNVDVLNVVELPGLSEKGDIINWAAMPGNDRGGLLSIVAGVAVWTPARMPKVVPAEIEEMTTTGEHDKSDKKPKFHNTTDLGNAERLVAQHGDKIRYSFAWTKWLVWDGKRWRIDDNGKILRLAKSTVKNIYKEAYKSNNPDQFAKWASKSQGRDKIIAMIKLAESEEGMPISPGELDTDHYLLNCQNGTLDLRTGTLQPHDPANFITKIIPVKYDQGAACSAWIDFLETFFNWNYDLINFVQRAVGYSLTGDTSEQCLFIPHGEGENGKSTFIDTVSMLLCEYAQAANVVTFMIKRNDGGALNDIARMQGVRFISAVESEEGKRLSEVLVKQLTGGDTLSARFLYGEFFDFKPEAKIWLACNHKPAIRGTDHAIWRRIKLIPFNVKISPEKKLPKEKVMAMFRKELPGILTWAVQGCMEWQRNGLQTPDEVQAATGKYREEMDTVGQFLDDTCILTPEVKAKASGLYDAYKAWCDTNGEYVLPQRKFGSRLTEKGLERVKSNGNFWKGISLKN